MHKHIPKWGVLAIVLVGLVLIISQYHRPKEPVTLDLSYEQAGVGVPIAIQIPVINVNAKIEQVAMATDGSMDVPKIPSETAWYKLGPRPGETGSAVIAGHVNWKNGARAVFADLHTLKQGDKILVLDHRGITVSFLVREIKIYSPNANASEVFNSSDGKAHLNLVTCIGSWNENAKAYTQRLVVFADKE